MINFSIHLPSIVIGFLIGYTIVATIMIYLDGKDRGDFARGWDYGYEYGRNVERAKIKKEMEPNEPDNKPN